jgi:hypothetical protein
MRHAGPAELVDLAEGAGTPGVSRHVEHCAVCTEQLRALRAMVALNEVARDGDAGDVPEISPLFWTHFPGRVRTALERAVRRERSWWPGGLTTRWAVLALTATLVTGVGAGLWVARLPVTERVGQGGVIRVRGVGGSAPVALEGVGDEGGTLAPLGLDRSTDEPGWALVLQMAESARWNDLAPTDLFVADRAAERAIFELSVDEREELKRLLELEIGSNGAGTS